MKEKHAMSNRLPS